MPHETDPLTFSEIGAMLKEFWASVRRVPGYVKWAIGVLVVCGILVYSL